MRIIGVVSILGLSLFLFSCSTKYPDEWYDIEDSQKRNIHLQLENGLFNRTSARAYRDSYRWIENGKWEGKSESGNIRIWISVYSLYDRIFSTRSRIPLVENIRDLSGNGYLALGKTGSFKTQTGLVDYQFYNVSGLACVFVENYWSSPSVSGVDAIRNGRVDEYIIGDARIQGYYCNDSRTSLEFEHLENFLAGIKVTNIHWPKNRFAKLEDI